MTINAAQILSYYHETVKEDYFLICRDDDSYAQFDSPDNNRAFIEYVLTSFTATGDAAYQQVLRGDANYAKVKEIFTGFMGGGERCPEISTYKLGQHYRITRPFDVDSDDEAGQVETAVDGTPIIPRLQRAVTVSFEALAAQTISQSAVTRMVPAAGGQSIAPSSPSLPPVELASMVPPPSTSQPAPAAWAPLAPSTPQSIPSPATLPFDQTVYSLPAAGSAAPGRPAAVSVPPPPRDIEEVREDMNAIIPVILEILQTSNDAAKLYEALDLFRTQYLMAMRKIAERISLIDEVTGQPIVASPTFSENDRIRINARAEIMALAKYAEIFAQYILDPFNGSEAQRARPGMSAVFLEKLSVPERALFMAQFHMISNFRQKALQLGEGANPQNNISDTELLKRVNTFNTAWVTLGNPERYMNTVLSRMRAYISEQKGFWNWMARGTRLWRLKTIKVTSAGNISMEADRQWQIYRIFDGLLMEASGRNWSGLNVEIGLDGGNRSVTIHSKNDSFGDLKEDKDFKEILEQLGGVWERPAWYALPFASWRRWRIPFDRPESSSNPPPPSSSQPPVGTRSGSSASYGMGYGSRSSSRFGMSRMWSDEQITAADEEITAYDPDAEIEEYTSDTGDVTQEYMDDMADTWDAGIAEFFGIPEFGLYEVPAFL